MHKNTILLVIIATLGGFIGGFMLANAINRSEINSQKGTSSQTGPSNTAVAQAQGDQELSPEEIKAKIAEADKNPGNFTFQKDLGVALYRYAAMKQDEALLGESVRILDRANTLGAKDFDVLVALGNAHFDLGFAKKETTGFQTAREIYTKALELKPADADVATDLGLTWFLQDPPSYDKASTALQKVSDANPKHERSLQFLVQSYVKQNKMADAEKALAKLKSINPANTSIAELSSEITAAQNGVSK